MQVANIFDEYWSKFVKNSDHNIDRRPDLQDQLLTLIKDSSGAVHFNRKSTTDDDAATDISIRFNRKSMTHRIRISGEDGQMLQSVLFPSGKMLRYFTGANVFFWVSDPLCLSSSSDLHFFRLFFSGPPPC
jgi:hypothetical protein